MSHCTCDYHQEQNKKLRMDNEMMSLHPPMIHQPSEEKCKHADPNSKVERIWTQEEMDELVKCNICKHSEEKKDWEKGNLSTIIEKKEDELESLIAGLPARVGETPSSVLKSFLEKAIRESVEEALLEVRPGSAPNYYDATFVEVFGRAIEEYDSRVKEFMK